ncbi:MAG: sigma-54-dependent Fis family transcriptional regulator [Deltaproteobacteria bacterium]|nr:sigma-54-dependent Fis family transcriptional regulator [Deltaproteobacteria bacterium]
MSYHVLWIDDEVAFLQSVQGLLGGEYQLSTATTMAEAFTIMRKETVDLILLDIDLGGEDGLEGLKRIKHEFASVDVVMVTGKKDPKLIVQAVRSGATDYICKPFAVEELTAILEKLQPVKQLRDRHDALIADLNPDASRAKFIGVSVAFRQMVDRAERVKGHQANLLLEGESGTGKELLARHVHSLEGNSQRPFIAVNCAAIPEGLLESELFGHEKGAFTGASARKIGKFELANGGDIFLDEISALKLELQAKILRVLQEKEIVRVGGTSPIRVNFRVIAAANEPLDQLVAKGAFRMDLFHRLRVIPLRLPPLRERREDIPILIAHFLEKYGKITGPKRITAEALRRLQQYDWPGNVRELENVIHSLVILSPEEIITENHLPPWALAGLGERAVTALRLPIGEGDTASYPALREYVKDVERRYIEHVLTRCEGDKSRAATALDIGRTTLYGKLKELGLME